MKRTLNFALAAVVGLLVGTRADAAITLGLTSVDKATIHFEGSGSQSTITFTNDKNGNSFGIRTVDGSSGGSPTGLFGSISGSFTYLTANITTVGSMQTAALDGVGLLSIGPADGPTLTANITGIEIFSLGKNGGFNGLASVINLSNVSYSGENAALLQFMNEARAGAGIASIGYQFSSTKSLSDLAASDSSKKATYSGTLTTTAVGTPTTLNSGTLTTVPEPGSMGMAFTGVALVGLGYFRQQRRKLA